MAKQNLQFPLNLGDEYKGKITFSIASSQDTGTSQSSPSSSRSSFTQALGLQSTLDFYGIGGSKSSNAKASRGVSGGGVTLYLPPGLQYQDGVDYGAEDLGISGALVMEGRGIASALLEDRQSFIQGLIGGASGQSNELARLVGVEAAKLNPAKLAGAKAAGQVLAGVAINPNTRVLFRRVNLREFAFSFKLIAKSSDESQVIEDIIKFFRKQLYPETFNLAGVGVGYKFPEKFNIKIVYEGSEGTWNPPLIKQCYLKGVATTFNSSSMAFHKDGKPVEIDLALTFMESQALERKDIEAGY